jgi:hypothetical protein
MAVSYRNRLNGKTEQFIEDVAKYGIWGAMERYGFKDYLAARKLILEETGDENYGIHPKLAVHQQRGIQGVLREVVAAFADYVIRTEKEKALLRQQLEAYQTQYGRVEIDCAEQLLDIAEALRVRP